MRLFSFILLLVQASACADKTVLFIGNSISRQWAFALSALRSGRDFTVDRAEQKNTCGSKEGEVCSLENGVTFVWIWEVQHVENQIASSNSDIVVVNTGSHYIFTKQAWRPQAVAEVLHLKRLASNNPSKQFWFRTSTRVCADVYGQDMYDLNSDLEHVNKIITDSLYQTNVRIFDAWETDNTCDFYDDNIHSSDLTHKQLKKWLELVCPSKRAVVTSKCRENIGWLRSEFPELVVCAKRPCISDDEEVDDQCSISENKGHEVSSYLKYIITRYSNLPETVAFVHGHISSWHDSAHLRGLTMSERIRRAKVDITGYVSLSARFLGPLQPAHYIHVKETWGDLIEKYLGPFPCPVSVFPSCCSEFIVTRERITDVPLQLWQDLYDFSMGKGWEGEQHMRRIEWMFHLLFGQPCVISITDEKLYIEVYFGI